MRLKIMVPVIVLAVVLPASSHALISRCIGPGGEILYTDQGCPQGYALGSTFEASPGGAAPVPSETGKEVPAQVPREEVPGPVAPDTEETRPDAQCRAGTFSTDNHGDSYDVYFESTSSEECRAVNAYCLCSLSFGAYRQSRTISITGIFRSGEKVKIGEVETTGPADRDIDWSWCDFR